jgi:hypothetical protein
MFYYRMKVCSHANDVTVSNYIVSIYIYMFLFLTYKELRITKAKVLLQILVPYSDQPTRFGKKNLNDRPTCRRKNWKPIVPRNYSQAGCLRHVLRRYLVLTLLCSRLSI